MSQNTNTFYKGINYDQNPYALSKDNLSDAMNATCIVTSNGNEGGAILNEMGNTKIKDALTGGIVHLREGFIPVGIKEHGGILYIASYNQTTGEGELGTFPSPNITYSQDAAQAKNPVIYAGFNSDFLSNNLSVYKDIPLYKHVDQNFFIIFPKKLYPGDQFALLLDFLNIEQNNQQSVDPATTVITNNINGDFRLSTVNREVKAGIPFIHSLTGWYDIQVGSLLDNGLYIDLNLVQYGKGDNDPYFLFDSQGNKITSNYPWFPSNSDVDMDYCRDNKCLFVYPNLMPGYLCLHVSLNTIKDFLLINKNGTAEAEPSIQVITL